MNTRSYKDPFPTMNRTRKRYEPIEGYTDGTDYAIACKMCEIYAESMGWSHTRRYDKSTTWVRFAYEFSMSKYGARDSRNPALSIKVAYNGGHKCVELKRYGDWTAIFGIREDGTVCSGQYQGETGIDDLMILRDLYHKAREEYELSCGEVCEA